MTNNEKIIAFIAFVLLFVVLFYKLSKLDEGNSKIDKHVSNINRIQEERDSLKNLYNNIRKDYEVLKIKDSIYLNKIKENEKEISILEKSLENEKSNMSDIRRKIKICRDSISNLKRNYKNLSDDLLLNSIKNKIQ